MEEILIYGSVFVLCAIIVVIYMRKLKKASEEVEAKIEQAKQDGLFEPVSLHPVIDLNKCIGSAACVAACPEQDILGLTRGKASLVNASHCVGHGACFHSCPVEAISLVIGTEKRGVDLPHVNPDFESNVPGIYIAGELGGMGLIKNSVEQGQGAVESMIRSGIPKDPATHDLIIVGAGPAGISATLTATKHKLDVVTLEQDSLGGTVFTFPRSKIVMTAPMDLPLHGKVKLFDTSKTELLDLWNEVLSKNNIRIREHAKVEEIRMTKQGFEVETQGGEIFHTKRVLLAIGRRGSPRKLGIPGEESEKVAYRLLEPELIHDEHILVVGGGDSAIEAALSLMEDNQVTLSYRKDAFARIKPKNREKILAAINEQKLTCAFLTNPVRIDPDVVILRNETDQSEFSIPNQRVFIFAGGELPTQFLEKTGVKITKRFGYTVKKHH
ncbi:MAG: NAD(P)-binding domain-containing protein [Lewinellaceae bacterium]|nr:NAD(P)-binding domain-containing protein [Lewinellaceae bacterium]